MEKAKQVGGSSSSSSSSSSFTTQLFGPKEPSKSSSSSSGLFSSVFGPPSTGLGRDSTHTTSVRGSSRMQDSGNHYGNAKYETSDNGYQRNKGDKSKDNSSTYQNETVEPCYLSSSIYYGGQDVYSPRTQTTGSHSQHIFKKDGGDDDDQNGNNSNCASRGNWWQGSLYY